MATPRIVMFDPGTGVFSAVSGTEAMNNQGKLLLNILIELRVLSQFMATANQGNPQSDREDIVDVGANLI